MRHKVADGMEPLHQKMSAEVGDGGEEELPDDPAVFPFSEEKPSQSENESGSKRKQQIVTQRQAGQYFHAAVERLSPQEMLLSAVYIHHAIRHGIEDHFIIVSDKVPAVA